MSSTIEDIDIEEDMPNIVGEAISNVHVNPKQSDMWQHFEKTVNEATNKTERTKNPLLLQALSRYISAEFHSSKERQVERTINILWFCFLFNLALIIQHRCQVINTLEGFNVFVVCIMLSTAGGYCVWLIRNQSELAVLRRCYFMLSSVSMALALSILGYALLLESFRDLVSMPFTRAQCLLGEFVYMQVFMITSFIVLLVWFLDSEKICVVEEKVHLRFVEVEQILHWERHIGQIVVLGGAFSVNGNVNPIAEATVSSSNLTLQLSTV
ncbi:hypothetical protein Patl1_27040 [Pistacia atlantica]|uniref:Uncharacterized protein n=1 Tax=Pistacia atlantica TaxID=434234 RepID=A0ACC1B3M6_9ROSI|nr:hypothetical protein Patl1_27040 [Pistacia atlantica]